MIIVTGGAGFIGSNIVLALNNQVTENVVVVDDLSDASKINNLVDVKIIDYIDRLEFARQIANAGLPKGVDAVFHQGACSDTMATDGKEMMETNFTFSKTLLKACDASRVPLIYASSAAVYGRDGPFVPNSGNEKPLNVYGYSKMLFDELVTSHLTASQTQLVGLRYFNVYGHREDHKARMASIVYQLFQQYSTKDSIQLFEGTDGFSNGEQRRDFISVKDVVAINLYMLRHPEFSGIVNVGTGCSRSFNDVALAVINECRRSQGQERLTLEAACYSKTITYCQMPRELHGKYQSFTEADLEAFRVCGYAEPMLTLEDGISDYIQHLQSAMGVETEL